MSYIDGFVAAVPVAKKSAYLDHARQMLPLFMEYGALQLVETWSDDVPHGKLTDFYRAVQADENEAVVFSWVLWPDKTTRDAGWKAMMGDARMNMEGQQMPFDGKRMIYGGFEILLDSSAGSSAT